MAASTATSDVAKVTTTKPGAFGSKTNVDNFYTTKVTTGADGSFKRETFRTDAQGNDPVRVYSKELSADGVQGEEVFAGATAEEKEALNNPDSQLSKSVMNQTNDAANKLPEEKTPESAKKVNKAGGGSGNDAENDNDAAATKPAPLPTEASIDGTRTEFPTLVHPTGLGQSKQDVIRFDMMEYQPQDFAATGQFGFTSGRVGSRERSIGSVTLPIPAGISDQSSVEWGSNSMTAIDAAKAMIATTAMRAALNKPESAITEAAKGVGDGIGSLMKTVKANSGAASAAIANSFAAAAAGVDGQSLLSRTTGQVLNPNMELLFKGPTLRPFQFTFTLAPRDKDEALRVVSIIRFFKQGMAPIRSKSNLFLKSPHTFQLRYLHRGEKEDGGTGLHFKLNAFKECALQTVGVNYTPTGNYATYQDGTMVAYELTLGFSELEPIYNDDFGMGNGKEPDDAIGF